MPKTERNYYSTGSMESNYEDSDPTFFENKLGGGMNKVFYNLS
jgi:hypothetical protein